MHPHDSARGRQHLAWATEVGPLRAYRRAQGRRMANLRRSTLRHMRQVRLVELLRVGDPLESFAWGWQARVARQLGVHRSTVLRDWRALRRLRER